MKLAPYRLRGCAFSIVLCSLAFLSSNAYAQSCQTSGELDDATRAAITAAGQRFFDLAAKGDAAAMRLNAIGWRVRRTNSGYHFDA